MYIMEIINLITGNNQVETENKVKVIEDKIKAIDDKLSIALTAQDIIVSSRVSVMQNI